MSGDPSLSLVVEAKKCKYTLIPKTVTCDEVLHIWVTVSHFIIRRLVDRKAVNFPGLGLFSVLRKKIDIGNNGKLWVQRPIFILSEKFAQTHGITYTKYQSAGEIPVIQLNFAMLAAEAGFERDLVEICIKEMIGAFARTVNSARKGELNFREVGKLVIKDGKAKMKFFKDFLKAMDGSRPFSLSPLPLGRPRTSDTFISRDSVMTESSSNSLNSRNLVLPRIGNNEVEMERPLSVISNHEGRLVLSPLHVLPEEDDEDRGAKEPDQDLPKEEDDKRETTEDDNLDANLELQDAGSQLLLAPVSSIYVDHPLQIAENKCNRVKTDLKPSKVKRKPVLRKDSDNKQSQKTVHFQRDSTSNNQTENTASNCNHQSGQELCYLCHQRQRRNIPISFEEERKRDEQEQDRVLQKYQQLRDQKFNEMENKHLQHERRLSKEVAQFNLAASENLKAEQTLPKKFHQSYIFLNRKDCPNWYDQQTEYSRALGEQLYHKTECLRKLKEETGRLEQEEQRYLAAELAASRKRHLMNKAISTKKYESALHTQIMNKPFQLPKALPDSDGSVFGKLDMTEEKLAAMRNRAKEVLNHQLKTMKEKKDKSRSKKELNRQHEMEVLNRTKKELREETCKRYQMTRGVRRSLERSWAAQHAEKRKQDHNDRRHEMTAGLLLLDQCKKYQRCDQCQRNCENIGVTNVWPESRYLSGSRLMI
ncbi:hypothetical protein ACHWQZ_G007179 [Mnemiopsis leidyi]